MDYKKILITGGAGFVGSNLAILLKDTFPKLKITVLDNLSRRGSELNVKRLREKNISFVWGDVRNKEDLNISTDLIIECSAEPSVMAGVTSSPNYLIDTNLIGAINCLENARKNKADIIFLSTSRVYPIEEINKLDYFEDETRFKWKAQKMVGFSSRGIGEEFSLGKKRSLYGATKLCSEYLIQEYISTYNLRGVINRCGLISGPWQMGKIDQGVVMLWLGAHFFNKKLSYIGYNGLGKQVRDVLHVYDLFELLKIEILNMENLNGEIFNVGGGVKNSVSLLELTGLCQKITGNTIPILKDSSQRFGDIRIYITDNDRVTSKTLWKPKHTVGETLVDMHEWMQNNQDSLRFLF